MRTLKIVNRKITELKPAEYNPRQLTDKEFKDLQTSFKNLGTLEPAVINQYKGRENIIISGHQRLKVAASLEMDEYPCYEVSFPLKKEREANIRMNKNTGGWDLGMLESEFDIDDLKEWGFEDDELEFESELKTGKTDDDHVPEAPNEPVTKLGDLYQLGEHRLLCGDATKVENVDRLMNSESADFVFTDPMYDLDSRMVTQAIENTKTENVLLMCTFKQGLEIINESSYKFNFDLVLYNPTPSSMMNKNVPYYHHKNLIYLTKGESIFNCDNAKGTFSDNGYYPSVIKYEGEKDSQHGLSKPVESIYKIMSGFKCKIVVDLFAGSGSIAIGCEKTNRKCYMMELDPTYCDIIVSRWEEFTGNKAELI